MRAGRAWRSAVLMLAALVGSATLFAFAPSASAGTTTDIASLAKDNVGKKACSTTSLGGSYYYSSCTGNGGQPEYWCADFARWVWAHNGIDHTGDLTAAARSFYTYGVEYDTFSTNDPQVGDAVVFSNSGSAATTANTNDIHHVGLVVGVSGDDVDVVSGDWGGTGSTQAEFAGSSHVVANPRITAKPEYKSAFGKYLVGYVSPVGVTVATGRRNSGAAVYVPGNNYHVFGITGASGANGGALFQNTWNSKWEGWQNLAGDVGGTPAVTYNDGRYDVFAVGDSGSATTGAVWQKTFQNGEWSSWHSIGGSFNNRYGVAAILENGDYHVFAISPAGTLMQRTWNGSWGDWQNLGGVLKGTPAVTYHGGRFDVFGTGENGQMYQKTYTPGDGWGSYHSIGGVFGIGYGTAAVYDSNGNYHVFGISPDGVLYQRTWNDSWGEWQNLGGDLTGTPSVTLHGDRFDVFGISPDGDYAMYQKTFDDGWSSWHSITGDFR